MPAQIPYRRKMEFEYGNVAQLSPNIRRVLANNPSPFTFHGTGTYVLGRGNVAVIDPGPALQEHVDAILAATQGETISHVLITHTHNDHSPAWQLLKAHCPAKTYAYGPHGAGKLEQGIAVEEGGDFQFQPDIRVKDGDVIQGDGWSVECVYTPGHTSNHMCFQLREEKCLFTGDHVMGWSTSIISPPDGDMKQYMASLEKLLQRDDVRYWPTHGPCIDDTRGLVNAFIEHRHDREQQIIDSLKNGIHQIRAMVPGMYADLPEFMYPAAARSVFAAVAYLVEIGRVQCDGELSIDARYRLAA